MSRGSNYPAGGTPESSQIIWLEQRVEWRMIGRFSIAKLKDEK